MLKQKDGKRVLIIIKRNRMNKLADEEKIKLGEV
jgi:hypothetical protein